MKKYLFAVVSIILIISSCKLKEDTTGTNDSGSNNTGSTSISISKPNGGESLSEGSSSDITWTGSTTSKIRIQYSVDSGASWSLIADSISNTGVYTWFPVPNKISNQCLVRVSSVDNTSSDVSEKVFSIIKNSNENLKVITPAANQHWEIGTSQQIKWYSSGIDSVKIEYTPDNGTTWSLVGVDKKNTGIYFWDPVPNPPSVNSRIRISNAKKAQLPAVTTSTLSEIFFIDPQQIIKLLSPNGGEKILAGTGRKIEWTAQNIEKVKLAYTSNNGFVWNTIAESIDNVGFYQWSPVPNITSSQCRIRVYNAKNGEPNDASDSTFTITNQITKTLDLLSPIGGEKYRAGTSPTIKWISSGITKVNILFTKNNWITTDTIISKLDNVDSYDKWVIPDFGASASACKIKVTDVTGDPKSESKASFTITPKPDIWDVRPNSGASWVAGVVDTIRWKSIGVENVFLQFTADNGKSWTKIVEKTAANGLDGKYAYSFSTPGTQYRINVVDADYKSPEATSNGTFTVTDEPRITVVSPNGTEEWYAGSSNNIKWTSTKIENVKIEYTTNSGATWNLITSSTPSTGVYAWNTIPAISSLQCRIRISNATNGIPTDMSDDNFTITNPGTQLIKVKSPNGGEVWPIGSAQDIKWDAAGITNVKIEYTTNNGINWTTIVASTPSSGFYTWSQIPATLSTNCKIRISDASDNSPSATSDAFFTIGPPASIKIIQPNGNDTWISGTTREIKWTSENVANVKIEYTTNAGGTWFTITNSTASTGSYLWQNIPEANNSLQCRLRISEALFGSPSTISVDNFAIMNPGAQQIAILKPNGGESWNVGSMQNIIWDAGGIANIKIEYTTNNGNNWITIVNSTPSNGYYTWNPIPNTPGTNCRIRISDAADGDPSTISVKTFSILPAPTIKVISPNGGETILFGAPTEIQYLSENIAKVKIEYTTDGGAGWTVITDSTVSIGTYTWTSVPNTNSMLCRIRVSDASNGTSSDISDNPFSISNIVKKSVKVLSPNGGETWEAGTIQNITWNSSAIAFFKVELSTNKGSSWSTLADNYQGGGFQWRVPANYNSTQCQIRLSDVSDNTISDISDAVFTILPIKFIRVLTPSGPSIYKDSDTIRISWESSGIQYVGIRYTTTLGIGHSPDTPQYYDLVTKIANTGSFTTSFPYPSDQYFIVVYNADDGSNQAPSARSNGSFTVVKTLPPKITVVSPNGGEQWLSYPIHNTYEIKWTATNVRDVMIEYSANGGSTWNLIVANTPNSGSYSWTPTVAANSDNCLIRISDVAAYTIPATSSNFFSLRQNKMLTVIYPNKGEDFYKWSGNPAQINMTINWISYAVTSVDIFISIDNGVTWDPLIANYQSTGAYVWSTFDAYPPSRLCRIKVVDHDDSTISDVNDIPCWINLKKIE